MLEGLWVMPAIVRKCFKCHKEDTKMKRKLELRGYSKELELELELEFGILKENIASQSTD